MRSRIESLSGLKVLALAAVFWLHAWGPRTDVSIGGVAMHVFFCCSGFLVAYRYWQDESWEGLSTACSYLRRKIVAVWPLYITALAISVLSLGSKRLHQPMTWWDIICDLFLLQAWGTGEERLQFSINGPTWFLSAILFCYFLAPMLLGALRRFKCIFVPFAVLFAMMYGIEVLRTTYRLQYFELDLYTCPFYRALEFGCAMCLYPIYRKIKEWLSTVPSARRLRILMTLLEIGFVVLFWKYAVLRHCLQAFWMLWFLLLVLILSLEGGLVSRLLGSAPFRILAAIEMEFFVFHFAAMLFVGKHLRHAMVLPSAWMSLAVTFAFAVLYHRFCAKRASEIMDRALAWLSQSFLYRP